MHHFTEGDRVRIDIPDESDIDYERFHGAHGTIISILNDDADEVTGDDQDSRLYRVDLEDDDTMDFRGRDLRPPIE